MKKSKFVYVTYIKTTPEKLWRALLEPEFTRQYFFGIRQECDRKPGASWRMFLPDGNLASSGSVVEIDPPRRLVLVWKGEKPDMKHEPASRMTYEITTDEDGLVKLTVHQESEVPESVLIAAVSKGWPMILSNLKTFLETGEILPGTEGTAGTCAASKA